MTYNLKVNKKLIESNISLERALYLLNAFTKINKRVLLNHIQTEECKLTFSKDDFVIELVFNNRTCRHHH